MPGKLAEGLAVARQLVEEAQAAQDRPMEAFGLMALAQTLSITGDAAAGSVAAEAALNVGATLGGFHEDTAYVAVATAALAAGDAPAARRACEAAMRHTTPLKELFVRSLIPMAEAALSCGDIAAAHRWANDTVAVVPGCYQLLALTARARVAIAQGEVNQAHNDLCEAVAVAERTGGYLRLPDTVECLGALAAKTHPEHAVRLFGAADAMRQRHGEVRCEVFRAAHETALSSARNLLTDTDFDVAWSEGAELSTAEVISYAQRGRGARGRPASGWESLTRTELDVVGLVSDGLSNRDIASRLFISPRTVQSHLTHVYTKLGISSRVQLAQEAARHR